MPELYTPPQELPQIREFLLGKKKKDTEPNPDCIWCDPEVESSCPSDCSDQCDPESDSGCDLRDMAPYCPFICPLDSDGDRVDFCEACLDPDVENNTLPVWLRLVAQIIGALFEFHVVWIAILPWWLIGIVLILVDLVIDYTFYLIFFLFCKPCAYILIWIVNIPMIFIHIPYWWQRVQLELIGFIFDGWTLIFGGDGCFCRWGQDCWFAKKTKYRNNLNYTDLVWLTIAQPAFETGGANMDRHGDDIMARLGFFTSFEKFDTHMNNMRNGMTPSLRIKDGNPAAGFLTDFLARVQTMTLDVGSYARELGFEF